MTLFLGRSGAALFLCLVICVALGLSGCQGARSRSNTLSQPEPTTAAERRGNIYLKSGSLKGALQEYDRALAEGAPADVINWRKGNAYFSARMWEKAYVHFRKAINENPDWALAQEGAGFASFEMGEFRSALGYFERSSELNPNNWVPHAFLAVIHKVLGNSDASTANHTQALELAGEDGILVEATIKRAYAKAVLVFEEQGNAPESTVAASGESGDPLGRLESLAADQSVSTANQAQQKSAAQNPQEQATTSGWEVVEEKRLPGKILGMNGTMASSHKEPGPVKKSKAERSEVEKPKAAKPSQALAAAKAANATVAGNATREIADHTAGNATQQSGLSMSENGSVTVIESPGYEEMAGTLGMSGSLSENATGAKASARNATAAAAGNATGNAVGDAKVATPSAATKAALKQQQAKAEATPEKSAPAKAVQKQSAETEGTDTKPASPASTAAAAPASAQKNATKAPDTADGSPKVASKESAPQNLEKTETLPKKAVQAAKDSRVAGPGMVYAVLESSFRHEQDAVNRIAALKKQGVRAHLVPSEVKGKGFWYRVMIGPRKELQACKDIKVELKKRFGLTDLVILKVPESKF